MTGGTAKFSSDGTKINVKGTDVKIEISLSWADNPRTSGKAVGSIKIADKIWRTKGKVGSKTHTITLSDGKSGLIRNDGSNNSAVKLRNKGKNVIEMEDVPDDFSAGTGGTNDEAYFYKDIVCSATEGEFYNLQGRKCKYRIPFKGNLPEFILAINSSLISTPIVFNPDFANDNAVGRPILPIPITQTRSSLESKDFFTSSKLFMFIFKLDIIFR